MGAWENREASIIDKDMLDHCLNCPYPDCIDCAIAKNTESKGRFSDEEIELLRDKNLTNQELSEMLGRDARAIQQKRLRLKISKYKEVHTSKHNWTKEDDRIILNYKPSDAIAMTGRSLELVYARRAYLLKKVRNGKSL